MPVIRDMACRARQSKERYRQQMEQGMADRKPQRRTDNCRSGPKQTNYKAWQRRQFRTSQDQDHDKNRTMQGHCGGMGQSCLMEAKARDLKESGQINNGPVHGHFRNCMESDM